MNIPDIARAHGLKIAGATALALAFTYQWVHLGSAGGGPRAARAAVQEVSHTIHAEGRLVAYPGAEVVVGTDVGGTLAAFPLLEGTQVQRGDLVAEIEASEQRAALGEARARVAQADVEIGFLGLERDRSRRLVATDAIGQAALDRSQHDLDAARTRRQEGAASVVRLSAALGKTHVVSPIGGVVMERFAEPGETVPPGARLVTVADLSRTRIEAEVDEYDVGRVALGQAVVIRAEGFAGQSWGGKVEDIPDQVTSRRIKPQDPGRPSDTRVLLVKVALSQPLPVKLGQRVELEILK